MCMNKDKTDIVSHGRLCPVGVQEDLQVEVASSVVLGEFGSCIDLQAKCASSLGLSKTWSIE